MSNHATFIPARWITALFILTIFFSIEVSAQITPLWEKSQATASLPSYIGTANNERGFGYGVVNGNPRLYLATITGGAKGIIMNALTGDSVGVLSGTGITGGTLTLTDLEVSADGIIFGCNLVTSSSASTPFKIYKWTSESADPVVAATWETGTMRLGDKFTVVGSASDNSLTIYASSASSTRYVKFTTTDNGATFTGTEVLVTGLASSGTAASLAPVNNGVDGLWLKGGGQNLRKITPANVLQTAVHADHSPTGGNAVRYYTNGSRKFLVVYQNGTTTTITGTSSFFERGRILEITSDSTAEAIGMTPTLGTTTNSNASGDVAVRDNGNGTFTLFVFSTNNGIGAYTFDPAGIGLQFNLASTETFTGGWPPAGWARYAGFLNTSTVLTQSTSGWVPDDYANVTSPANRSAKTNIFGASLRALFVSPTINLGTGTPAKQVEFNLALTTFAATTSNTLGVDDTLAVVVSTDNGVTWSSANIVKTYTSSNLISNTGQIEKVSLAGYSGLVRIGFYSASSISNADNDVFIDDVRITDLPLNPVYAVNPQSKDFGMLQINTTSASQSFTISNSGAGDLVINSAVLGGTNAAAFVKSDTNTYPKTLLNGQSMSFSVAFAPADTGMKMAGVLISHNSTGSPDTVELYGQGVDFTIKNFPYVQNFDSIPGNVVPPPGWENPGGYWLRGTEARSLPYAARVTYNYSSTNRAILMTPPVNLPANAKITFWWKDDDITAGRPAPVEKEDEDGNVFLYYPPEVVGHDTTYFEISTDGGTSWVTLGFLSATAAQSAYEEAVFDLSSYAGNNRYMRWRDVTNATFNAYGTGLDDIVIEVVPQITMDWNNLQWPPTATITAGGSVDVYTKGWENGVTPNPGPDSTIKVWIGVSSTNTNPNTWTTWIAADYHMQQGNDDEYKGVIGSNLPPGTYYYASRWQLQNGPYTYGGYNAGGGGFWDGTGNVSGVLTVNPFTVSQLPYQEGFEGESFPPTGWTVLNVNADPKTWVSATTAPNTGTKHAAYSYSTTLPANDWLVTPGVNLTAGKTYRVAYYYRARSASFAENLKVAIGSMPVADSLYTVLADHPGIVALTYQLGNAVFTAPATGFYYIGFHAYSPADRWDLWLDDVAIVEVPPVDYAVGAINQLNGIPTFPSEGLNGLVKGEDETTVNPALLHGVPSGLSESGNIVNGNNSYSDDNLQVVGNGGLPENVQANVPVSLNVIVANAGLTGPAYVLNSSIAGEVQSPVNRPGVAPGTLDTVNIGTTVLTRGTFTTSATVVAAGDTINAFNNMGANHKTLVYPDSTKRMRYDNGSNVPNTFIGFSTNNISLYGAVRFNAIGDVKLTNIDAFYRTESSSDSIMVGIWGPGADSTAPGPLLYTKKFGGVNYLSTAGDYHTLPLGDNAPGFQAGSVFWVSLTFNSEILFPLGAHNSPLSTPGRSFISADTGKTWSPLIVTTERAWFIRAVGVNWQVPMLTTSWEKSVAMGNLPAWFSSTGSTERGFGYGRVNNNPRIYVPSRNGGNSVRIVNAITGNDVGTLDLTGVAGGTFPVNDAGVTMDGKILVGNLAAAATDTFKVYMWNDETSAPVNVISFLNGQGARLGDKITVVGDFSNNTAQVWASSSTAAFAKVYRWSMTAGAFNATPDSIILSDAGTNSTSSVGPMPSGAFFFNANGISAKKYSANGTLLGTIPGTVVATGSNAIRYMGSTGGIDYFATFQYGAGNQNARVVGMPGDDFANAFTYGITPPLGAAANTNGTGDVEIRRNPDGSVDLFVMATNNGFGVYHTTTVIPVELSAFAAHASGSEVVLNWSTASEINNSGFMVERKAAGSEFTTVTFIEGKGNTAELSRYTYTDKNVAPGAYTYRLKQVDFDGTFSYSPEVEVNVEVPGVFELSQNYPNPFNPATTIKFALPKDANVVLAVYNLLGEKVATIVNGSLKAGNHSYSFDASALSSGLYIYKIEAGDFTSTKKMMLLK